jgi:hypothetical protein
MKAVFLALLLATGCGVPDIEFYDASSDGPATDGGQADGATQGDADAR